MVGFGECAKIVTDDFGGVWLQYPAPGGYMRFGPFLGIAILLMILWAGGFLMFHVASGLIHLLLLFAVISLIVHFVSAPKTA
jgi:hypothetical protein